MLFVKGYHRQYDQAINFFKWFFGKCGLSIVELSPAEFEIIRKGVKEMTLSEVREIVKDRFCPIDIAGHKAAPTLCRPTPFQPTYTEGITRLECPDCGIVIYRKSHDNIDNPKK